MVAIVSYDLDIEGTDFTDEEVQQRVKILGELIIEEVETKIRQMTLMREGSGDYLQGWNANVIGNELVIENTQPYALFLEYGTYAYHDMYGFDSFPKTPDPKKMHMSAKEKKNYPKGGQPFASCRRVLYDRRLMTQLIRIAFS